MGVWNCPFSSFFDLVPSQRAVLLRQFEANSLVRDLLMPLLLLRPCCLRLRASSEVEAAWFPLIMASGLRSSWMSSFLVVALPGSTLRTLMCFGSDFVDPLCLDLRYLVGF